MPTRQTESRNITGIYLGLEGNVKPPKDKAGVPPLARTRGISYKTRTPVEERRYQPASYYEKKQMVELNRIKDEKQGFVGQPLKKHQINGEKRPGTTSLTASPRRWGPARRANSSKFSDRIRTNPRHYTSIINSGVTRSENLTGFSSYSLSTPDIRRLQLVDHVPDNYHHITSGHTDNFSSISDSYRRLYEGDVDNLLPRRHTPPPSRCQDSSSYRTGFSVRSYRNPNQAEILADFPDPRAHLRPKTVPVNQAFIPQPYFFRYYNHHHRPGRTVSAKSKYSQGEDKESGYFGNKTVTAPGAGNIYKNLNLRHSTRHKHNSSPVELDPSNTFHRRDESESHISMPVSTSSSHIVPSQNIEAKNQIHEKPSEQSPPVSYPSSDQNMAEVATIEERRNSSILLFPEETRKMRPLKTSNSGADITLGLEDVDGATADVEIDVNDNESEIVPEDIPRGRVRKASIVEKLSKTKASEAYVATVKESAEQRAKNFEKLLNEHAEIVQEISRTASAENLSSAERDP